MALDNLSHTSDDAHNFETSDLTTNKSHLTALKREIAMNLGHNKEGHLTEISKEEIMKNLGAPIFSIQGHEITDTRKEISPTVAFNPETDMRIEGHEIIDTRPQLAQAA